MPWRSFKDRKRLGAAGSMEGSVESRPESACGSNAVESQSLHGEIFGDEPQSLHGEIFGPDADWFMPSPLHPNQVSCRDFELSGQVTCNDGENAGNPSAIADLGASQVPRGKTVSASGFSQLLARAFVNNSQASMNAFKMPWELGVYKDIFASSSEEPVSQPFNEGQLEWVRSEPGWYVDQRQEEHVRENLHGELLEGAIYEKALSVISDRSFKQNKELQIGVAVEKWYFILSVCFLASETGRQIVELGSYESQKDGARRVIRAVMGTRSERTAIQEPTACCVFCDGLQTKAWTRPILLLRISRGSTCAYCKTSQPCQPRVPVLCQPAIMPFMFLGWNVCSPGVWASVSKGWQTWCMWTKGLWLRPGFLL